MNSRGYHFDTKDESTASKVPPKQARQVPVSYECRVQGHDKIVSSQTFVDANEVRSPESAMSLVHSHARSLVGASSSADVECQHVHHPLYRDPSTWVHRKMAPNCDPHYDVNQVTTINNWSCYYAGQGEIDGKMVTRPFARWSGRLASCDGPDEYMQTSDLLMDAVKESAYHQAGGDEAKLNKNDFVCFVQSLPHG
tara:strand:- start:98 stop:685 length:588 start_codon:yes stop_codon:yes gene_type:complete